MHATYKENYHGTTLPHSYCSNQCDYFVKIGRHSYQKTLYGAYCVICERAFICSEIRCPCCGFALRRVSRNNRTRRQKEFKRY